MKYYLELKENTAHYYKDCSAIVNDWDVKLDFDAYYKYRFKTNLDILCQTCSKRAEKDSDIAIAKISEMLPSLLAFITWNIVIGFFSLKPKVRWYSGILKGLKGRND